MKKIFRILFVVCLCAGICTGLCACGNEDADSSVEFDFSSASVGDTVLFGSYEQNNIQDDDNEVTWGNCTLRAWLNSTFYEKVFNAAERKIIAKTEVYTRGRLQNFIAVYWEHHGGKLIRCLIV